MATEAINPNVDVNETQAPTLLTVLVLLMVASLVLVGLRLYTRMILSNKRFLEDYFILIGVLTTLGMTCCMIYSVMNGFGRHKITVTPYQHTQQLKVAIPGLLFYHLSHIFIKSSILLQFLRICVLPIERRICYGLIAIVCAEGIAWSFTTFLSCTPFPALWTPGMPGARCINQTAAFYSCAALLISADLAIIVLPAFLLRHSLLRWHQKMIIGFLLAFGGIGACLASIFRTRLIYMATASTDSTWDKGPNAVLGAVEVNLGIICSSIVTLKALVSRCLPESWRDRIRRKLNNPRGWGRQTLTVAKSEDNGTNCDVELDTGKSNGSRTDGDV